jgi:hypothetical protein
VSLPVDPDERERRNWQIAFERCEGGTCCRPARRHRPQCLRRAEWLQEQAANQQTAESRHQIGVSAISEIGGRKGCTWMVSGWIAIPLLAGALSWWVVYR